MDQDKYSRDRLPHPMQPIGYDGKGVIRFKENKIVSTLLDHAREAGYDLNDVALAVAKGEFSREDHEQLAQLIGYSVSGFGDLSYVRRETVQAADLIAREIHVAAKNAPTPGETYQVRDLWWEGDTLITELTDGKTFRFKGAVVTGYHTNFGDMPGVESVPIRFETFSVDGDKKKE